MYLYSDGLHRTTFHIWERDTQMIYRKIDSKFKTDTHLNKIKWNSFGNMYLWTCNLFIKNAHSNIKRKMNYTAIQKVNSKSIMYIYRYSQMHIIIICRPCPYVWVCPLCQHAYAIQINHTAHTHTMARRIAIRTHVEYCSASLFLASICASNTSNLFTYKSL